MAAANGSANRRAGHGVYTGDLKLDESNNSLVPDFSGGTPDLQTLWLEATLAEARRNRSADMIVVFMHQVPMSTSASGNGSDLGIRQARLALFDKYEVDLVFHGHEHDYERTYPVRGYEPGGDERGSSAHDGTTTLPTQPTEKFVFGRQVGRP